MISKLLSVVSGLFLLSGLAAAQAAPPSESLPLSTHSKNAERLMEKVWVLNSEVVLPINASHNACTFARFGLLATLPHGESVEDEQGSSCGNATTACVGPWNSSATFGARVAA